MFKIIRHNNNISAIIVRKSFSSEDVKFFTPNEFSQQLGYMKRPKGHSVKPHMHKKFERNINSTQEVLYLKRTNLQEYQYK